MTRVDDDSTRFVRPAFRHPLGSFDAGTPDPALLRLDLNEGPNGPFPAALRALAAVAAGLNRYPDAGSGELRRLLAERHDVSPEHVLVGPGSNPLGALLVRLVAGDGGRVVYSWPGFPSYAMFAARAGADGVAVPLRPDGHDDLDALLAAAEGSSVLFLATPANPTGRAVGEELEEFLRAASERTLVVVDEAYHEYGPPGVSGVDLVRNGLPIVALRTFSKIWGLAGMRIGYAVLPPALAASGRGLQETFEVSTPAQVAAAASLGDEAELRRRVDDNARLRAELQRALSDLGVPFYESWTNFVCAGPPDPAGFVRRVAAAGVLVRHLPAFGDDLRVRIGVPGEADLDRVLSAISSAVA